MSILIPSRLYVAIVVARIVRLSGALQTYARRLPMPADTLLSIERTAIMQDTLRLRS
jgi:hypothetical protein